MENHNSGKFTTGFLLGAMIGAAAVFLLGTKKGKKILKAITDEGINLQDLLKTEDLEEDEYEENPEIVPEQPEFKNPQEVKEEEPKANGNGVLKKAASSGKRFFKRKS